MSTNLNTCPLTAAQLDELTYWAEDRDWRVECLETCVDDESSCRPVFAIRGRELVYVDGAAAAGEVAYAADLRGWESPQLARSLEGLAARLRDPEAYALELQRKRERREAQRLARREAAAAKSRPATGELPAFTFDDGGRHAAGFRGFTGDCVTRALAIVTGRPYREVYDELTAAAKRHGYRTVREGLPESIYASAYRAQGGTRLARLDLPGEHLTTGFVAGFANGVVRLRGRSGGGHVVAVVDGVVRDTWDCTGGVVLEAWSFPAAPAQLEPLELAADGPPA